MPHLVSLDWNSDNLCNLACISCGPRFSSRWSAEISHYPWDDNRRYEVSTRDNQVLNIVDFSNLRRVYFNGGEPLMSRDHINILTRLQSQGVLGQCEISYNTNGTQALHPEFVSLWRQARLVRVMVSVDAVGAAFEYVRWPAKWHQVQEFINKIYKLDLNVIVDITCTVGIHNVFELPTLIEWFDNTCRTNPSGDPSCLNLQQVGDIGYGGRVLDVANIGNYLAARAFTALEPLVNKFPMINVLIDAMQSGSKDPKDWKHYLEQLDRVRGTNWKKSLSKLQENLDCL